MQIVINIPEKLYSTIKDGTPLMKMEFFMP